MKRGDKKRGDKKRGRRDLPPVWQAGPEQLEFFKSRGGRRPGAGRKPRPGRRPATHHRRPPLSRHHPVHVTTRMCDGIASLRRRDCFRVVHGALVDGAARNGFRIIELSVQSNHLHLIVEATDETALARGMQGLKVRIARRLNRALGRSGTVFMERYHGHVLRTPREVRNAIAYVLNNARRHAAQHGRPKPAGWIDPCSTARAFHGLQPPVFPAPRSWLLRVGWHRAGAIHIGEVPGLPDRDVGSQAGPPN